MLGEAFFRFDAIVSVQITKIKIKVSLVIGGDLNHNFNAGTHRVRANNDAFTVPAAQFVGSWPLLSVVIAALSTLATVCGLSL